MDVVQLRKIPNNSCGVAWKLRVFHQTQWAANAIYREDIYTWQRATMTLKHVIRRIYTQYRLNGAAVRYPNIRHVLKSDGPWRHKAPSLSLHGGFWCAYPNMSRLARPAYYRAVAAIPRRKRQKIPRAFCRLVITFRMLMCELNSWREYNMFFVDWINYFLIKYIIFETLDHFIL